MIEITDTLDKDLWNDFVYSHPNGNIFQTYEMGEVFKNTKKYAPISLAAVDAENNEVLALVQGVIISEMNGAMRGFTSRAVIQGGPLVAEGNKVLDATEKLMQVYNKKISSKAIYTQIRNMWDTTEQMDTLKHSGYEYSEHLNFLIDLKKDKDDLWNALVKSRRNGITKSKRLGVTIEEVIDNDSLKDAYSQLKDTYSNAKLPFADISLFESVMSILIPANMANIWVAKFEGQTIGAIVTLVYKNTVFDWYAGSSVDHRKYCPNDILPWHVIEWGADNGYEVFDFGGAGSPHEYYGVREFKKQYGGKLVNFGRYELKHSESKEKLVRLAMKLYQRL
jgi:lipid II:glycine glycyltransferase (peptidoglycan interpeptide bridge formation enzyme)